MKGTIEKGEHPRNAAERELREESGLIIRSAMKSVGRQRIGQDLTLWHFFAWHSSGLPDRWHHVTEDDYGHTFTYFWHPIHLPPDQDWHEIFHKAFEFIASRLSENRPYHHTAG